MAERGEGKSEEEEEEGVLKWKKYEINNSCRTFALNNILT